MKSLRVVLLALAVAACSGPAVRQDAPGNMRAFELRQARLQSVTGFSMQGRVGVRAAEEGFSGGVDWMQRGGELDFSFRGPLGSGTIRVAGDADRLRVRTSKGEDFVTSEAELEFSDQLGWKLPVRSMRYWMLGIPDPQRRIQGMQVDTAGQLLAMRQEGWRVEIRDYQSYGEPPGVLALPRRLEIRRPGLVIKLAIRNWHLHGPSNCAETSASC